MRKVEVKKVFGASHFAKGDGWKNPQSKQKHRHSKK